MPNGHEENLHKLISSTVFLIWSKTFDHYAVRYWQTSSRYIFIEMKPDIFVLNDQIAVLGAFLDFR